MTKAILKKAISVVMVATMITTMTFSSMAASVIGANDTHKSTYNCDFEGNYLEELTSNRCTNGVLKTESDNTYFVAMVRSYKQTNYEVYNSSTGLCTLNPGSTYVVSFKYKVNQISSAKASNSPTVISLSRNDGANGALSTITDVDGAEFFSDIKTDWIKTTTTFQAGEYGANNILNLSVSSPTCQFENTRDEKEMTIICFDDVVVKEFSSDAQYISMEYYDGNEGKYFGVPGQPIELETPTRECYTFNGWFTDADCTKAFSMTTMPSNSQTKIYASWTVDPNAVSVSFVLDDEVVKTEVGAPGTDVTLPTANRQGCRFAGWYDETLTTRFDGKFASGDTTVYAKFEIIKECVSFTDRTPFGESNNTTFSTRFVILEDDDDPENMILKYDIEASTGGSATGPNAYAVAGMLLYDDFGNPVRVQSGVKYAISFKYKVDGLITEGHQYIRASDAGTNPIATIIMCGKGGAWSAGRKQPSDIVSQEYKIEDIDKGWISGKITFTANPVSNESNYVYFGVNGCSQISFDNIEMYVNSPDMKYAEAMVSFETNGGSYVETQYANLGDPFVQPECEREGYRFLGWTTDEEGVNEFSDTEYKNAYTTLYAYWYKIEDKPADTTTDEPSDNQVNDDVQESNSSLIYIIIIGVAALLVVGGGIAILVVKKKGKTNKQ